MLLFIQFLYHEVIVLLDLLDSFELYSEHFLHDSHDLRLQQHLLKDGHLPLVLSVVSPTSPWPVYRSPFVRCCTRPNPGLQLRRSSKCLRRSCLPVASGSGLVSAP